MHTTERAIVSQIEESFDTQEAQNEVYDLTSDANYLEVLLTKGSYKPQKVNLYIVGVRKYLMLT